MSSTPPEPCYSLGEYVRMLVAELDRADPDALARMREVVEGRSARIALDDEAVDVWFEGDELVVEAAPARAVDGAGATDTPTVLDLMDGYVEPRDAILDGRLDVAGSADDVHRIFVAIEILLDAAPRSPGLQALARAFRADPCRPKRVAPMPATATEPSFPPRLDPAEEKLLRRLDLLRDGRP